MGRWLVALATLLLGPACGGGTDGNSTETHALRIASFDFAESEVLAEVYAQAVESADVPVARLGRVGPREVLAPAMRDDAVDLVPEYLGSALLFAEVDPVPTEVDEAFGLLEERLHEFGIDALRPSSAIDVNVFVVTSETAARHGLVDISDLASARLTRIGGPAECVERPLCLVGLADTYGVTFDEFLTQPSLVFTAESLRRGEVDVGVMFSTAPEVGADDLVVLRDDRRLQPPENVVPVIRRDAIERWGAPLREALDDVSGRLTTEQLRRLNQRVADGEPVDEVARWWLRS